MAKAKKTKSLKATSSATRRKKKSPGAGSSSTTTLDPHPGASSMAIGSEIQQSIQPTQQAQPQPVFLDPALTPPVPQIDQNPYLKLWNAPAWATVHHHPQTAPSFAAVNPLQTHPTFASTSFPNTQYAENVAHSATNCTTPVPLGGHVAPQSSESSQHLANTSPPRGQSQSSGSGSDTEDTPSPSKSSQRIRVSRRNPIYGLVEGAMSGNRECSIARKVQLRDLQPNASLGGRRFKRQMEDIVCRAERLSVETECWEALDDASDMVSTFHGATYALNLAKRKDAKEITASYEKQLAQARSRNKEVEERGRRREQELLAEVQDYRARLASRLQGGATNSVPPETSGQPAV